MTLSGWSIYLKEYFNKETIGFHDPQIGKFVVIR